MTQYDLIMVHFSYHKVISVFGEPSETNGRDSISLAIKGSKGGKLLSSTISL